MPSTMKSKAEVHVQPDCPVETRMVPGHGIATKVQPPASWMKTQNANGPTGRDGAEFAGRRDSQAEVGRRRKAPVWTLFWFAAT